MPAIEKNEKKQKAQKEKNGRKNHFNVKVKRLFSHHESDSTDIFVGVQYHLGKYEYSTKLVYRFRFC